MSDSEKRKKISLPIIVEGKYDKSAILGIFDATVITTGGFSVFNSSEKRALIKRLAGDGGVILLTDSDAGGKQIRTFISSILPKSQIYNLYIPRIEGKEKRKRAPSKEGMLGVEGVGGDVLRKLLAPFAKSNGEIPRYESISKLDLFEDGLFGSDNASELRDAVCRELALPTGMNAKAFTEAVNIAVGKAEYRAALARAVGKLSAK